MCINKHINHIYISVIFIKILSQKAAESKWNAGIIFTIKKNNWFLLILIVDTNSIYFYGELYSFTFKFIQKTCLDINNLLTNLSVPVREAGLYLHFDICINFKTSYLLIWYERHIKIIHLFVYTSRYNSMNFNETSSYHFNFTWQFRTLYL